MVKHENNANSETYVLLKCLLKVSGMVDVTQRPYATAVEHKPADVMPFECAQLCHKAAAGSLIMQLVCGP